MHERTLRLHRDDPAEPGLLRRVYARVMVCWVDDVGGWCWSLLNAAGQPCHPFTGPFEAAETAMDAAHAALGGHWEEDAPVQA